MLKSNPNRKSGGSGQKSVSRLGILEAYRALEELGAVGSMTTSTRKSAAPVRPRSYDPVTPGAAASDVRSFARTATEGAKKPLPKVNSSRKPVRELPVVPSVGPVTNTGNFSRLHPLVPRTLDEIADYWRNDDAVKQVALSDFPVEHARYRNSLVTKQPEVESHLASPELTQYDNAGTNYAGLVTGGISEFKESKRRGTSEFLRFSTQDIAKKIAGVMGRPTQWKDYLDPRSKAFQDYWRLVSHAQVRSRFEDDPAALAMSSGSDRRIASIIAADPDIKDASTWGLLGRGALLATMPSRALAIYAGDLRRPENISAGEQFGNGAFDLVAQLLTGAGAERIAASLGEEALARAGVGGLFRGGVTPGQAAIKQGFARKAKDFTIGSIKAGARSWTENQAIQALPRIGQASDLSQKNGKSFGQNFAKLTVDDTAGMLRAYDPRVLADPDVPLSEKATIVFQHGLSLYHNREKALNLLSKWAKENRVNPSFVGDVASRTYFATEGRDAASGTRGPEAGKSVTASSSASKRDQALARWSTPKPAEGLVESSGTEAPHAGLHSEEDLNPEILRPGQISISERWDGKILVPGQDLDLEARRTGRRFEAPYLYVKQSPEIDKFTKADLDYFLKNKPLNGSLDIAALMVDTTHVGTYLNPETGAFFETQGGHDSGLTPEEYAKIGIRNNDAGAYRLHYASGALNGLALAYVGGLEANLSSAHSAHATKAEFDAAIRNGGVSPAELLSYVQDTINYKHKGSWKNLKTKYPVPNTLDEFYRMISRDSMRMPHRKDLVKKLFSRVQDILPDFERIAHLLSSEELRDARAGDVIAALFLDPNSRPAHPSSFGAPDHLAYNLALAGIHLGKTRRINIRELFPEDKEAAKLSVRNTLVRRGEDPSKISDGQIYSRMRYLIEHRKDRRLIGRSNAILLRKLVNE